MIVLVIIGIVLFILALLNWGQSEGHFGKILRFFGQKPSSDGTSVHNSVLNRSGNGAVINRSLFGDFTLDSDYAYNDDSDYD